MVHLPRRNPALGVNDALPGDVAVVEGLGGVVGEMLEAYSDLSWALSCRECPLVHITIL